MERSYFTPLAAADGSSGQCQFCSTCTIDAEEGAISAPAASPTQKAGDITLKTDDGQITAIRKDGAGETALGALVLPEMADPAAARVRILGYSLSQQDAFLLRG